MKRISLTVGRSRDQRDCGIRNDLFHEYDPTPHLFTDNAANVKAQIHFREIGMKRNRNAAQFRLREAKTDDACKRATFESVEFDATR